MVFAGIGFDCIWQKTVVYCRLFKLYFHYLLYVRRNAFFYWTVSNFDSDILHFKRVKRIQTYVGIEGFLAESFCGMIKGWAFDSLAALRLVVFCLIFKFLCRRVINMGDWLFLLSARFSEKGFSSDALKRGKSLYTPYGIAFAAVKS